MHPAYNGQLTGRAGQPMMATDRPTGRSDEKR